MSEVITGAIQPRQTLTGTLYPRGNDGYTPVKGVDYFTEAEKQEIAEQAAAMVEVPEGSGGGVTEEQIATAVEAYMAENPNLMIVSGGGTATQSSTEIYNHVMGGGDAIFVLDGEVYQLDVVDAELARFVRITGSNSSVGVEYIFVRADKTVTAKSYSQTTPTALPNPHALTINGTSYDGSEAVDLTNQVNALIDTRLGVIENGTY